MMTLFNKKANQNDHIDRISDLPSNVIDGILGNLKIRDQVRTSILSTKWRYMWTSAPHLCFDDDFFEKFPYLCFDCDFIEKFPYPAPDPVISKIITDVLMIHNGPIHKFSVCIFDNFNFEFTTDNINLWIPFISRDIKHLELVTLYCTVKDQMPDILFSCKDLTYFKFSSFNLSIPPNFHGFKKLLELHLVCVEFESSALESLMSGCPFLEKLSMKHCTGCDYLVISSPSLKVLVLRWIDTKSICLKKANNLIDFTLTTDEGRGFIKSLPKIKRFSLANWEKIPIADIIPPMLLTSSFRSLEYLKVDYLNSNDKREMLYFVSVLKSAPKLIELDIKSYNNDDSTEVLDPLKGLECRSCCLKLQTVNIYVRANSQHATSLIQFILANSPLLRTLTFDYNSKKIDTTMLFRISQDLLLMERASPRARIKFGHSTYP